MAAKHYHSLNETPWHTDATSLLQSTTFVQTELLNSLQHWHQNHAFCPEETSKITSRCHKLAAKHFVEKEAWHQDSARWQQNTVKMEFLNSLRQSALAPRGDKMVEKHDFSRNESASLHFDMIHLTPGCPKMASKHFSCLNEAPQSTST